MGNAAGALPAATLSVRTWDPRFPESATPSGAPPARLSGAAGWWRVVVDDEGHTRVVLGQDPATTQRSSRGAGLALYDEKGSERAGFSTMADGSVVLGLDAPLGVGAPMRDRIGLKVHASGSAYDH